MFKTALIKKSLVGSIGGWMLSKIMPIAPFLAFTIVLVFCDLITGLMAAKKRKETIHSKGLRRTVQKIVLYFIAIILSQGIKEVFMQSMPITYMVAFIIAIAEFKSNIENIEAVTDIKIWSFIQDKFQLK